MMTARFGVHGLFFTSALFLGYVPRILSLSPETLLVKIASSAIFLTSLIPCFFASPLSAQESQSAAEPKAKRSVVERGEAAFYSNSLEGHQTACGGTYSPSELTAAHPTLRCGTKLRVTNLRNGKTVRVTVNDHLPSHKRVIDLSYAAAQALDFVKQGTTLVKVEVVR